MVDIWSFADPFTSFLSDLPRELGSEFWAAIVGAITGGLISYLMQRQSLRDAQRNEIGRHLLADRALAFSLYYKALSIAASFYLFLEEVKKSEKKAHEANVRLSEAMLPIVNLPPAIEFSSAEMACLLSLKDQDTFNSVLALDRVHNGTVSLWPAYAQSRETVQGLAKHGGFDWGEGKSTFVTESGSFLEIKMFECERLALEIKRSAVRDFSHAQTAVAKLEKLFNDRLQLGMQAKIGRTEKPTLPD